MIATILPSSANFHAVGYNENKVGKGTGRLLEMKNFGHIGILDKHTPKELQDYLIAYSSRNARIKNAQLHMAFSCKGHEMTDKELLEFAHQYLREMGYGDEGQPLLVYSHFDTDNTHIHIVTSRVNPAGKKINDSHERVRSQAVLNRLLGNDAKAKATEDLNAALAYSFSTIAQFRAIMSAMGYEVYEKNGQVCVKRDGALQINASLAEVTAKFKSEKMEKARRRQLRAIFAKYRDVCTTRKELQSELKKRFGLDLVFFGREDSPYGYMIVDHNRKLVFNGGWVLKIDQLLDFASPQERFDRIDSFIDRMLERDPFTNTSSINKKLLKTHTYIKRDTIHFNGQTRPLKDYMAATLLRNDMIVRAKRFNPASEEERRLLCRFFKIDYPSLVRLSSRPDERRASAADEIRSFFANNRGSLRSSLRNVGFKIFREQNEWFAIDFSRHIILNLGDEGFDTRKLSQGNQKGKGRHNPRAQRDGARIHKLRDAGTEHGEKREWEVGYKGDYDRIDDETTLKV